METEGSPPTSRGLASVAQWRLALQAIAVLKLSLGTATVPQSHTGKTGRERRLTTKCKSILQRTVPPEILSVSLHLSPPWTVHIHQCSQRLSEWRQWYNERHCLYRKYLTKPILETFRVRLFSKAIKLSNCVRDILVTISITAAEERKHSNALRDEMVVTWRDSLPPSDSSRNQMYPIRGDKIIDSRNPVGKFYVKEENQDENYQESGYCSRFGETSSLLPPSCPMHAAIAQVTVEEENRAPFCDVGADEDIDGEGECPSPKGSKTIRCSQDLVSVADNPFVAGTENSVTSLVGSLESNELCIPENNADISISVKDAGPHIEERHSVASAERKKVTVSDDETDGRHPVDHLHGSDEDSALGYPTPASLSDADSQDICYVNSSATSGFSEEPFPPPSHFPRYGSPSTQQPPHSHTRHNLVHLQHSNNTEVVQSISYTTNSFKKPTNTTETAKKETRCRRATAQIPPLSTQGITSPKLPPTLSTRQQHWSETADVHDGATPAVRKSVGKGDVTITTCAVPETSAGKKKDSLCLTVEAALLPTPMKAGLIVPSPTRLRMGGFVDSVSSVKRLTLSTRQESRPTHRIVIPEGKQSQAGCIVFSCIAAFEEGSFLPLPSREAVERSIGKGGNGTITIVYFKGVEFAVKRTHFRQMEVEILASLHHDNILPLQAVMMGEEDPQRPSRFLCYHFMPRMSGDLQSYLTKVGHGALSNLLMQHKEDPTMLQLVVDNTKHILRNTLKGLTYLHSVGIVQGDVKPSNFLTTTQCGCVSPLTCDHGQRFTVKLSDFDSALDINKVRSRHSVLRQFYRNNPTGTPGYRPPEYVLVATRTPDELDTDTLTAADVWAFGCSVLKIFLSHSGPHSQKQMAFLHLWHKGGCPREKEGEKAKEELKLGLLERVYPNWPHLWAFVGECLKVSPKDRTQCSKLLEHPFFAS